MKMYLSAGAVDLQKPRAPQSSACSCQFFRLHFGQTSSLVTRLCCVTTCCADSEDWSVPIDHSAFGIHFTVWLSGQVWWLSRGLMQSETSQSKGNLIFEAQEVDGENNVQCTMKCLCYIMHILILLKYSRFK